MDPWTLLVATKRTAAALERRSDALLGSRALSLTQLRLLLDLSERHRSYPSQLAGDLLLTRQSVHHHLAILEARGTVDGGAEATHIRTVVLTPAGRDLASRGIRDLAPLLERIARLSDIQATHSTLTALERASRPPLPGWQL